VIVKFGTGWDEGDKLFFDRMDANRDRPGMQEFRFVGQDDDPDPGEIGFRRAGSDTIVIYDNGSRTQEIELDQLGRAVTATDFVL
jgi:hypothetical protein